jgi:hypothetical protein
VNSSEHIVGANRRLEHEPEKHARELCADGWTRALRKNHAPPKIESATPIKLKTFALRAFYAGGPWSRAISTMPFRGAHFAAGRAKAPATPS